MEKLSVLGRRHYNGGNPGGNLAAAVAISAPWALSRACIKGDIVGFGAQIDRD